MRIQAVLLAGDRAHSKAVRGRSKGFLEIDGRPMVVHVLEALLRTPEVSEVFVVGNAPRLEKAIAEHGCLRVAAARSRSVHVVPQRETLYANIWDTFLRTLPPEGPVEAHPILVVPADIPLVLPEEISDFVRQAVALESDSDALVRGSAGELAVVFRNLLEHAVKYSDAPVEVNVRVRGPEDGRVKVEISDRGIGIPSDELHKIFQRFYRAGRDVQRTAAGLGLGLFIVRSLVRRQGGRVVARSAGFGQGSRFVVTLRAC